MNKSGKARLAEVSEHRGSIARNQKHPAPANASHADLTFLKEIESWRENLAGDLAIRNAGLSADDLNAVVQRTISRFVFLRLAEQRGLEPYGQLLRLCERPGIYPRFMHELCRRAAKQYESGLFDFREERDVHEPPDRGAAQLAVDDNVLKPILQSLYRAHGPSDDFGSLPVEILGAIHERFQDKVIRLTRSREVKIEQRPAARRAGGVYYTPSYIVDYIVKHTLGRQVGGRSPVELAGGTGKPVLRVLDPACGSGAFLLGAYQYLLDYCLAWYVDHRPETHEAAVHRNSQGEWRLSNEERTRLLSKHIYGVDIDRQAVEVSKLSLLLKASEREGVAASSQQTLFESYRALPKLADNIQCGNSLIEPDTIKSGKVVDPDEMRRLNVFDWVTRFPAAMQSGGFHVVVGNPPYDVMEKQRGGASWPHGLLAEHARSHAAYQHALGGKLNLFRFFLIRGAQLLRPGGRFGMIVPLSLLADVSTSATRKRLLTSLSDVTIDCFPQKDNPAHRVFREAKLSTLVLLGTAASQPVDEYAPFSVRTYPRNSFHDARKECSVCLADLRLLDAERCPVPLVDDASWRLCCKLYRRTDVIPLGAAPHVRITRGEINQSIYRSYITSNSTHARLLKGVEVGKFRLNSRLSQGSRQWLDEEMFLRDESPRDQTRSPRIATQRITGVDEERRIVATMVDPPCYFADSTNSIQTDDGGIDELCYLAALLNSRLFQWRFKMTSTNNNVSTNELKAMPYRRIDPNSRIEMRLRGSIVRLVASLQPPAAPGRAVNSKTGNVGSSCQSEASADDIDRLVYELYDLTAEEIAIVSPHEASPGRSPRAHVSD